MKKKKAAKYWENEQGEIVEFGKHFMRCFEKAGKLQFGVVYEKGGKKEHYVKFTLDKEELIGSDEGADYLLQTIEDWQNDD